MLPKLVYSKIVQSLKRMKIAWDQDRTDNPHLAPYEIDISLRSSIEAAMRGGKMNMNTAQREAIVNETIDYLRSMGLIVKSPYGGHIFPLPDGVSIPTKEEMIRRANEEVNRAFFGKGKGSL